MALQSDNDGFLIGQPATQLMKRLVRAQEEATDLIRGIRTDVSRLLRSSRQSAAAAPPAVVPRPARAPRQTATVAPATVRRTRAAPAQLPMRNAKGQFVARAAAITTSTTTTTNVSAPAAAQPAAVPSRAPRPRPQASVQPAPASVAGAAGPRNSKGQFIGRNGAASRSLGDSASPGGGWRSWFKGWGSAAPESAPSAPAGPGRVSRFFGSRRRALADLAGQTADVDATSGALREAAGIARPALDFVRGDPEARREKREQRQAEVRQKRSESWFKRIWQGITGRSGADPEKTGGGGILGTLASMLLPLLSVALRPLRILGAGMQLLGRAKLPIIGSAIAAMMYGSDAQSSQRNGSGGGISGRFATGLSRSWDIFRNGRGGEGSNLMSRIRHLESSGNYGNDSQRRAYLAGHGRSTASGGYQFLDRTFASVVARQGGSDPALAGLQPLAAEYLADRRGTRAKANDPKYAPLFAAKLNPASADAAMRLFTGRNLSSLSSAGIASPSAAQVYSVHLSGNTAISEAMQHAPDTLLSSVLSKEQLAANAPLFRGLTTVGDLGNKLNRKLGAAPSLPMLSGTGLRSSSVPPLPPAPDVSLPMTTGSRGDTIRVVPMQVPEVGQNVADRGIAHVVTGGIGSSSR